MLALLPLAVAPRLLSLRDKVAPADAIVLLGGDSRTRPAIAAALYRAGLAPFILISGTGDCRIVERALVRQEVPPDRLTVECKSRTTRENALFAAPILHERGWRQVILVTSWQHSGRAAHTFEKIIPDVAIASHPTATPDGWLPIASRSGAAMIYDEYAKTAWYCLAYRICP